MLQLKRAATWATVSLLAALTVLGVFATLALALALMERGIPAPGRESCGQSCSCASAAPYMAP